MKTVSLIIEWENALLAEMERCRAMLRELRRQIEEVARDEEAVAFDLLIVHDGENIPAEVIQRELAPVFPTGDSLVPTRLAATNGLHYYQLKNFGVRQVRGDFIFFLDSDVIPDPGWLKFLLNAFADSQVQVVGGNTYVDPRGLIGKTFALTWIFPQRSSEISLVKAEHFFANNVAFRREIILRFGFPEIQGAARGACGKLALSLRENGIEVYRHHAARVNHPPTNGFLHFIVRGVAQGRDDVFMARLLRKEDPPWREAIRNLGICRRITWRGWKCILKDRKSVNLSLWQTPFAALITLMYYQCRLAGALAANAFPGYMEKRFQI